MEAKHTPGKWETWHDGEAFPGSGIEKWVIEAKDNEDKITQIAVVESPNSKQDARLIAAAPELLAALEEALPHVRFAGQAGLSAASGKCEELQTRISALIAKAKGE